MSPKPIKDMPLCQNIILIGMMGSGKTSLGRELAQQLACPFYDSDEEIAKYCQLTVAEIFEQKGAAYFRAIEREILLDLLNKKPAIIASGGGSLLNEQIYAKVKAHPLSIWLQTEPQLIYQRLQAKLRPPLGQKASLQQLIGLYEKRLHLYQTAKIHFSNNFSEQKQAGQALLSAISQYLEQNNHK